MMSKTELEEEIKRLNILLEKYPNSDRLFHWENLRDILKEKL
jgi:hypothetical protein